MLSLFPVALKIRRFSSGVLGFAFLLTALLAWVYRRKLYDSAGYAGLADTENSDHPTRHLMRRLALPPAS